jgi:lipooligosaccharide transport system permease protein
MSLAPPLRYVERQALAYRRTWRASVFSNFLNPVLYLLAMGAGLGTLVDANADASGVGIPYLAWLGPGLLAAQAMQTGAGEGAFPVMMGFKWRKSYQVVVNTPLDPSDIFVSTYLWIIVRVLQVSATYAVVLVLFGVTEPMGAFLATLTATLTGAAFATPVMAFTSRLEDDTGLSHLFRFVVVPLFLFSGTFFPITQLPVFLQPVAWATPLWHGVELSRWVAIGIEPTFEWWISVLYLLVVAAVGIALTIPQFRRRLVV